LTDICALVCPHPAALLPIASSSSSSSFISTLVEGNEVFGQDKDRDLLIVLSVPAAVPAAYTIHCLYFDIDARLDHGDAEYVLSFHCLRYCLHESL
jgi:hypothetical protein